MAKGMFIGNSHANGGIPSEIAETGTKIEIEGNEYYICNEAYNSPNHFDFKKKTNKEILDFIYTEFACKLNQDIMHSGDFIVCKVVVADNRKKDRKGTIKQILNEMQGEKNCKVESSSNYLKQGGELIKRADGSYSKRGLWDNIRANIGSGRKPTKEMLKQEAIIKKMKTGGSITKSDINKLSINEFEQYLSEKYNSKVELSDYKKYIYLGRIEVPKQKRDLGIGSEIMSEIISYADYNDKKITLTPSKDYGASSVERLKDFYKKFGFIENKGRNKDFEISQLMYRVPVSNKYHLGGDMSKHLAPNGKPSNLTHEQWHLVRTDAFKQWFGDWEKLANAKMRDSGMDEITLANLSKDVSKVVDENGEPLVVYRGNVLSQEKLGYEFKLGYNFLNKENENQFGFFFTNELDAAKKYMLVNHFGEIEGGSITSVFLKSNKILNLLDFDLKIGQDNFIDSLIEKGVFFDNEYNYLERKIRDFDADSFEGWGYNVFDYFDVFPELRKLFIKNGFDCIIYYEISRMYNKYKVFVAFDSNQIKLADGTNTNFDSSNPDIKFDEGGNIDAFDLYSVYFPSDEEMERINEKIRLSDEQEKEDEYQKSSFSKKWAATRKIAIDKLVKQYLDAKKTYDDWASRQYKENKTNVFLGGDDIFGQSMSIGSINEGRKRKVLKGSKMLMDESVSDLKEIGLKDSEIDALINKTNNDQQTLFNNGGMINFVDSNYYESGTLFSNENI